MNRIKKEMKKLYLKKGRNVSLVTDTHALPFILDVSTGRQIEEKTEINEI
jgi:hypothetical protein